MVRRYLRRAGLCRTWGGVLGRCSLPTLVDYVVNGRVQVLGFGTDGTSAPLGFGSIFAGYLLGALVAEVATVRPIAGERRTASLARRELADYLPRRQIAAQRALTVAAALGIVATAARVLSRLDLGAVAARGRRLRRRRPRLRRGRGGGRALAGAPAAAVHEPAAGGRRRRHPRAVHPRRGRAPRCRCCCSSAAASRSACRHPTSAILRSVMIVPAVACLIASLVVIQDAGEGRWRVRRSVRAVSA